LDSHAETNRQPFKGEGSTRRQYPMATKKKAKKAAKKKKK
jgi:hypothetical protein